MDVVDCSAAPVLLYTVKEEDVVMDDEDATVIDSARPNSAAAIAKSPSLDHALSSPAKVASPTLAAAHFGQPNDQVVVDGFLFVSFKELAGMQKWIDAHEANRQATLAANNESRNGATNVEINCVRLKKEKAKKKAHRTKKNQPCGGAALTPMVDERKRTSATSSQAVVARGARNEDAAALPPPSVPVLDGHVVNASVSSASRRPNSHATNGKQHHSQSGGGDSSCSPSSSSSSLTAPGVKREAVASDAGRQVTNGSRPVKLSRQAAESSASQADRCGSSCSPYASSTTAEEVERRPTKRSLTTTTTVPAARRHTSDLEHRLLLASKGSAATPFLLASDSPQHLLHQYPFLAPFMPPSIGYSGFATPGATPASASYAGTTAVAAAAPSGNGMPPPAGDKKKGKWCAKHVEIAWLIYHHIEFNKRVSEKAQQQQHALATDEAMGRGQFDKLDRRADVAKLKTRRDERQPSRLLIDPALGVALCEEAAASNVTRKQPNVAASGPSPSVAATGSTSSLSFLPDIAASATPMSLYGDRLLSQGAAMATWSPHHLPFLASHNALQMADQQPQASRDPALAALQHGQLMFDPSFLARLPMSDGGVANGALARMQQQQQQQSACNLDSVLMGRSEQLLRFQEQMVAANMAMDPNAAAAAAGLLMAQQQHNQLASALEFERVLCNNRAAAAAGYVMPLPGQFDNGPMYAVHNGLYRPPPGTPAAVDMDQVLNSRLRADAMRLAVLNNQQLPAAADNFALTMAAMANQPAPHQVFPNARSILAAGGGPKLAQSFSQTLEQLARQKRDALITPTNCRS